MKKNILICNNSMGIGGVETVILNQISAFNRKGHRVFVIAKKGEFSPKVEELGGTFIEIEFPEDNNIDVTKVSKVVNLIKTNQITEIHIHKYQCIPTILIAALLTNTPYYAYEHCKIDTKGYYTWNFPIYRALFPIFFENAYKIIAITPKVAEITKSEYNFPQEKYEIIYNGIDFNTYENRLPNYNDSLKNIYIVSRIDKDKLPTIYNGIEAFIQLLNIEKDAKLNIIGGGNAEQEVKEYIEKRKINSSLINFLGPKTDVKEYFKKADLLLGVGRCVLESIAMKVPAVITGYEGINGLLTKENINLAMQENFSGVNMPVITEKEFKNDLLKIKENKKDIVNEVYKISREKLDCYKNYINMPDDVKTEFNWIHLFEILKDRENIINDIYNSKRWKLFEKINKITGRNKK